MRIVIITEDQKEILIGKKYNNDCYFNPIEDKYNNWMISEKESRTLLEEFSFLKELELVELNKENLKN